MINLKEWWALRKIEKGTTGWEKTKLALEVAVEALKGIISTKNEKIQALELESAKLMEKVRTTGNFINNTDKLYADSDKTEV